MDLFTSTPARTDGKFENVRVSHNGEDGCALMSDENEEDPNDHYDLDLDRRSLEADFAATFQSRSVDSSLYTTYNDLSAFLNESFDEVPITDSERVDIPVGSPTSSDPLTPHTEPSRAGFDVASLDLLKSKTVNRSLESILCELEQTLKHSDKPHSSLPDDCFQSAPLQRSRSLDSLRNCLTEADDDLNEVRIPCADVNKLKCSGLNGDISVRKDDTFRDQEQTVRTSYKDSSLTDGSIGDNSGRFENNGITPAFGADRSMTNHASIHYSSQTHSSEYCHQSDNTNNTSIFAGVCAESTSRADATGNNTEEQLDENKALPKISETLESISPYLACESISRDADTTKMETDSKENQKGGVEQATKATESDLMTVIDALRREAASWEEKYQELKQRKGSQSDDTKDYLEQLKTRDASQVVADLQTRLRDAESSLVDAREEIDELREEIDDLKLELEEAADRVREGDLEEYRDLKHDLDQVTKECRILQYRLRKSDRKLEQVEQEKSELEAKLRIVLETPVSLPQSSGDASATEANQSGSEKASASSNAGTSDEEDKAMEKEIANLKQQLKVAKDVSVRLHQELELIEEKRARTEEDNQLLRNRLLDSESARKDLKRDLEKTKLEVEFLRRKISKSEAAESSEKIKEKVQVLRSSTSSEDDATAEYDIAALLNDLQESTDRERDLQSQLQLVEEESEVLRKSLADVEQEKETIDFELERYKMRFGTLDDPKRAEKEKGVTSEKEAELRLQLMVIEQEATVMRRKLIEQEVKNEELEGALARLSERLPDEDEGDKFPTRQTPIGEESDSSGTEIDGAVDRDIRTLRQQIESLEQENGTLRMKLSSFEESENFIRSCVDKISKTAHESSGTKLTTFDLENVIDSLKRRLVETEYRNKCYELEIQTLKRLNEVACMPRDNPAKPAGRPKSVESKIRGQLALMHNEADTMRRKVIALEMANERLQEELDQKSSENGTSSGERLGVLQDKIVQLEEELGDLLTILRSKEISETQQNQEILQLRDNLDKLKLEADSREQEFKRKYSETEYKKEVLEQQLKIVKERAESMQGHLKRLCAGSSEGRAGEGSVSDDVFVDKEGKSTESQNVEAEKIFNDRITALEQELAEERLRVATLQREAVERTLTQTCQQLMSPSGDEGEKELLSFELDETRFEIEDLKDEMTKSQESLKRQVENLTDMNEELKVSNDLLAQERARLQDQLVVLEKERVRSEVRGKEERSNMEKSLNEFRRHSEREQSELKRALQDLQSEVDRLSAEKETLQAKEKELTINVENLSKLFEEAEAAGEESITKLKATELLLEKQTEQLDERVAKEVSLKMTEIDSIVKQKDKDLQSKTVEVQKLKSNNEKLQKEVETLKATQVKEKEKEMTRTTNAKSSWASEKSKLQADVTSLQKKLTMKEDAWKAERTKFLKEVSDLRQKIKDNEMSSSKKTAEVESRLEAATELVESFKAGETRFMEERKRLLKQIEDKDREMKKLRADLSKISEDQTKVDDSKKDFEKRLQRQEKVWKNEMSVYRFKLEAETRYFTEELGRLQKRLESETTDYSSLKGQMALKEEECQRLKIMLEASQKECKDCKIEQEKDALTAKRTRQILEDVQREKRELNLQLASQRSRCEMLQRGIASDKAAWQVTHTELQTRIGRLEQQTKLKKVKLEELQARLQAAWDQERAENMRLLTEANQRILQLESQVQEAEEKRQLDATTVREGYKREQKTWEDDTAKLVVRVRERDSEIQSLRERDRKYGQIDERFQRERDLWRRERASLTARLQESLETRKEDLQQLDEFINELNALKESPDIVASTCSPIRAKSTPPLTSKTRKEVGLSWPLKKQPSESHIPAPDKTDHDDAFQKNALTKPAPPASDRSASECDVPYTTTRHSWLEKSKSIEGSPVHKRITTSNIQLSEGVPLGAKRTDLSKPVLEKTVSKTSTVRHESTNSPSKDHSSPSSRTFQKSSSVTVKTVKTVTLQPLQQTSSETRTKEDETKKDGSSDKVKIDSNISETDDSKSIQEPSTIKGDPNLRESSVLKLDVTRRDASKPSTIESSDGICEKSGAKSPVTPLEVRSGRFDAKSFLRETEKKPSPDLKSLSPARKEIQKRFEEMEKSLVTSTKKLFEPETKTATPSDGRGSQPGSSTGTASPVISDNDSDRDRHTDTDVITRRPRIQSESPKSGTETIPKRASEPSGSDRISRGVERNRSWSPRPNESTTPKTSPGKSPSTQSQRYPSAPPGFLLPKQIKTPPSSNGPPASAGATAPAPPKPKPYNVPIAPSELAAFNEGPMKVLPGQLSKTKGAIQSRLKKHDSQGSNTPESPPTSPQRALNTIIAEDRAKRISPRSARANFFAEIPSTTVANKSTAPPTNGNNNYVTKTKDSNANAPSTETGTKDDESSPKQQNVNKLGPPARSSPWSTNPGAPISKPSGTKGKSENVVRKGSGGPLTGVSTAIKSSKPR